MQVKLTGSTYYVANSFSVLCSKILYKSVNVCRNYSGTTFLDHSVVCSTIDESRVFYGFKDLSAYQNFFHMHTDTDVYIA